MQLRDLAIRLSGCSTTRFVRCDPTFFFQEKSFRALSFFFLWRCVGIASFTRDASDFAQRQYSWSCDLLQWSLGEPGSNRLRQWYGAEFSLLDVSHTVVFDTWVIWPFFVRYCLEKLGVVNVDDHKALVIRVFWRFVQTLVWHRLIVEPSF